MEQTWLIASESLPGSTCTPWVIGGNNVTALQNIGTTSNYLLPFITNNTEKCGSAIPVTWYRHINF